jgi:hypothetical protein
MHQRLPNLHTCNNKLHRIKSYNLPATRRRFTLKRIGGTSNSLAADYQSNQLSTVQEANNQDLYSEKNCTSNMFKGQGTLILKLKNRRNDPDEFYGRKSSNTSPSKLL